MRSLALTLAAAAFSFACAGETMPVRIGGTMGRPRAVTESLSAALALSDMRDACDAGGGGVAGAQEAAAGNAVKSLACVRVSQRGASVASACRVSPVSCVRRASDVSCDARVCAG